MKILLSSWEIEALLRGEELLSLDLGVTYNHYRVVERGQVVCLEDLFCLPKPVLKRAVRKRGRVYEVVSREDKFFLRHVAIRDRHYYQLIQPRRGAPPTLEIDGIHMHKIKDVNPYTDARAKVRALGVRGYVWDTCGGLGYTTIFLLKWGNRVVTTEKDANVLELAALNPWSRGMWAADVRNVDARHFVKGVPDETFDGVLHDPPRFSLAGELYSLDFYRELHRVLVRGGRLYHYVGSPGRKRGKDVARGVIRRLYAAGFRRVERHRATEGVVALK